jgi:Domain of unknown function (DUF6777)
MITAVDCATCGTRNAPGVATCVGCGRPLAEAGTTAAPPGSGYPPPAPGGPVSGESWPPPPGPVEVPPGTPYPPPGQPGRGDAPPPGGYAPPPGGYPPGAPPGYGPYPPQPPASSGGGGRKGLLVVAVVLVLALVAAAGFTVLSGGDDEGEQVVLEPIDMVQEDDFAGNLDAGGSAGAVFADFTPGEDVPDARTEQVDARLAGRIVTGTEPAVYGGSRDTQVCDVVGLVSFLKDPGNEAKAQAWAATLGIEVADIESYVAGLTAVRLRWDTRVTNHGFSDGEATPFQSLLQAGTAVLVDDTGVPRVKCNCGNPLGEPTPLGDAGESDALDVDAAAENPDAAWEGLDPSEAVSIEPGDTQVTEITLVDVDTGGLLDRPVGSDGASKPDTGTGDVQLTLTWGSNADLDLAVVEPDGTETYFGNTGPSATGGQLDVDSNVGCEPDGGVENIFWPSGGAPTGTYTVKVTGYSLTDSSGTSCGSGDYTLDITTEGETETHTGTVVQDEVQEYTFDIP